MTIQCPGCKMIILREDRRRKQPLREMNGAVLTLDQRQAPRIRCKCGKLVVLLKASLQ